MSGYPEPRFIILIESHTHFPALQCAVYNPEMQAAVFSGQQCQGPGIENSEMWLPDLF